jgi:hypothetical protein
MKHILLSLAAASMALVTAQMSSQNNQYNCYNGVNKYTFTCTNGINCSMQITVGQGFINNSPDAWVYQNNQISCCGQVYNNYSYVQGTYCFTTELRNRSIQRQLANLAMDHLFLLASCTGAYVPLTERSFQPARGGDPLDLDGPMQAMQLGGR